MLRFVFAVSALIFFSQNSFAKNCDSQAISRALQEHQQSGLADPYILTHYQVMGRSVEHNSLFTVIRMIDSNHATFYTIEQNPANCKIKRVH